MQRTAFEQRCSEGRHLQEVVPGLGCRLFPNLTLRPHLCPTACEECTGARPAEGTTNRGVGLPREATALLCLRRRTGERDAREDRRRDLGDPTDERGVRDIARVGKLGDSRPDS